MARSFDSASGTSALAGAWGCEQRLVLAQIATDAKSNEITAVPKLLEMLSLKGAIETVDALNCQRGLLPAARRAIPERLNEAVRQHWGVENRLHWRLDVIMNEDRDRTRLGNGPHNLAVLRHMAMNAMQKEGSKGSLRGKLKRAGWDDAYLSILLAQF